MATSKFLSSILLLLAAMSAFFSQGATAQPPKCEDVLQERLDCYDTDGPCEPLPIPAASFGQQPDPAKGYNIVELRDGVYAIGEGSYWMMAAVAPRKVGKKSSKKSKKPDEYDVAIFDFPEGSFVVRDSQGATTGSLIPNALDEILFDMNGLTEDNIDTVYMVYSHQHFDHIGGASIVYDHIESTWMPDHLEIYGHEAIREEFEARIHAEFYSFRAPLPTVLIEEKPKKLSIGKDLEFTLSPLSGHTADKDLVIFLEADDEEGFPAIMMYVDVIFPRWAPFFSFAVTTDIFNYLESHRVLLEDFDLGDDGIFIGGHLNQLGSRSDIQESLDFSQTVLDGALLGLQQANLNAIAGESGVGDPNSRNVGNSWYLFDLYFKEVVRICAKHVVEEWGCVLGSVDVVVDSHCRSAQSYWRIDY